MSSYSASLLKRPSWPLLAVWLALFTAVSGCGSNGPKTEPVSGTIMLDGKPLDAAEVSFSPATPSGVAAVGKTDASGNFTLTTFVGESFTGAVAGDYTVLVRKMEEQKVEGATSTDDPSYGQNSGGSGNPAKYKPRKALVPAVYSDKATSPLKATVKAGGANEFAFELTKTEK